MPTDLQAPSGQLFPLVGTERNERAELRSGALWLNDDDMTVWRNTCYAELGTLVALDRWRLFCEEAGQLSTGQHRPPDNSDRWHT
jgi:hypothetical protein